jgi:hypothetical protein
MAAADVEIVISQFTDEIATKYRRLAPHFRGPAIEWKHLEYCTTKPEVENPIWRPNQSGNIHISACKSTSGSAAAILDYFPLPVSSHSDVHSIIGLLDHKNIGIADEIWLQSRLQAEI